MRRSMIALLVVPVLSLGAVMSVTQPAAAAVPDRAAWVAYNQLAAAIVPAGTWPPTTTVAVLGVGRYQVTFPGQAVPDGIVHVTAVSSTPRWCQAEAWFAVGADEIVNIRCYQVGGALAHSSFSAFFTRSSGPGVSGPYGYVDSMPSGALVSQYNSAGAVNISTHVLMGQWQVDFPGLITPGPLDGSLQATAVNAGTGARCKVGKWKSLPNGQQVLVRCFNAAGAPLDTRFTLTFQYKTALYGAAFPPNNFGYLLHQPPLGPPTTNFNSVLGLGANTILPAGIGLSLVTFPRIGFPQDTVQVTAFGNGSEFCGLLTFWAHLGPGPDIVVRDVNCFTNAGMPVNTGFMVSASALT